ncbi:hypothetical protein B0I73DRAFT_68159, partial [Yarrowia lipolytica]
MKLSLLLTAAALVAAGPVQRPLTCIPATTLNENSCLSACNDFLIYNADVEKCLQCLTVFHLDNKNAVYNELESRGEPFAPQVPVCGAPLPTITSAPRHFALQRRAPETTITSCALPSVPDQASCLSICSAVINDIALCLGIQSCICDRVVQTIGNINDCIACASIFDVSVLPITSGLLTFVAGCGQPTTPQPVCQTTTIDPAVTCDPPQIVSTCSVPNPQDLTFVQCSTQCTNLIAQIGLCVGVTTCICDRLGGMLATAAACLQCSQLFDLTAAIPNLASNLLNYYADCNIPVGPQTQCDTTTLPGACRSITASPSEQVTSMTSCEPDTVSS